MLHFVFDLFLAAGGLAQIWRSHVNTKTVYCEKQPYLRMLLDNKPAP